MLGDPNFTNQLSKVITEQHFRDSSEEHDASFDYLGEKGDSIGGAINFNKDISVVENIRQTSGKDLPRLDLPITMD